MPPRFNYWTIIFGGQPTSFRSGTRDELLPTFKQIQAKHPDAQLRFFARGKLWYSEEEAQAALIRERFEKGDRSRPPFRDRKPEGGEAGERGESRERRNRDWRPGGDHKDPRDRYNVPRDVKRARFKARLAFRRPDEDGPKPDAPQDKPDAGGWKPRPEGWKPKPGGQRPEGGGWRPKADDRKPRTGGWKPKPGGQRPEGGGSTHKPRPAGWKPRKPFKKKDEE